MPTALQTPIRREDAAQQVGPKRWRKQILPVGKVPYEGKDLEFSADYLAKTVKAFNEGAYDQVAFQLADGENKHNLDPEKTRGEVSALELSDDGVYAIFDLSDEGAKLVAENPKLGVSCRIVQDHPKGPAIQHVLGTLDPRATGMKPWEALDLAKPDSGMTLIDLSDEEFTVPSSPEDRPSNVSTDALTEAEIAAVRKRLSDDDTELSADEKAELDAAVEKITGDAAETETVALSAEAQQTIDLAKSQAEEAKQTAEKLADDLAAEKWKAREALELSKGVPPATLALAKPHLSKASAVIDLSNADSVASTMSKMIEEQRGTIDFSERGATTEGDDSPEAEARKIAKSDEWDKY
jgi:hypothetical protein